LNIELIILAAVAVFVISRLYAVLGQRTGAEPRARRMPAPTVRARPEAEVESDVEEAAPRPSFSGPGAAGLEAISEADPGFTPDTFLRGARKAYEMIVTSFADGDRAALKPLLDADVYGAYEAAIAEREASGAEPLRMVRLRSARIEDARLDAGIARVSVAFEADLSDGETLRRSSEVWTFKRPVKGDDPNWLLDEVSVVE
jgi:predicted lipid-binding transport protein (Tim44 family)